MTNREPLLLLLLLLLPLFTRQRLCGGRDARHPLTFRKGRDCSILLHPCGYGLCVFHRVWWEIWVWSRTTVILLLSYIVLCRAWGCVMRLFHKVQWEGLVWSSCILVTVLLLHFILCRATQDEMYCRATQDELDCVCVTVSCPPYVIPIDPGLLDCVCVTVWREWSSNEFVPFLNCYYRIRSAIITFHYYIWIAIITSFSFHTCFMMLHDMNLISHDKTWREERRSSLLTPSWP